MAVAGVPGFMESCGIARVTEILRPSISVSFILLMASSMSSLLSKCTKPNPLERLVALSSITLASVAANLLKAASQKRQAFKSRKTLPQPEPRY